jgi:hypothetical protein
MVADVALRLIMLGGPHRLMQDFFRVLGMKGRTEGLQSVLGDQVKGM